jgi:hypothetical protein
MLLMYVVTVMQVVEELLTTDNKSVTAIMERHGWGQLVSEGGGRGSMSQRPHQTPRGQGQVCQGEGQTEGLDLPCQTGLD